jgi:peptide/nickel transport system permease protein
MLRYALRRILWAIPTLIGTSLVLFFVTTLAPDPASPRGADDAETPASDPIVEEARRTRFLDLPRFVNTNTRDVVARARTAVAHVAAGDGNAPGSARELQRLGGAALPYVLPLFETLPPDERGRVALALVPLAERMQLIESVDDLEGSSAAALFWTRFWDDRALDFTSTAVDRGVARLVEHGSDLREKELISLDTFALPEIVAAMATTHDPLALARLTRLARHASERGPELREDATPEEARHAVADWQEWWFVHSSDFVALDGADRALAVLTETRYGKWLWRAASGQLGVSVIDGEPIASKLAARAPLTLLVCALALLFSWMIAVPLGVLGAWRHGRPLDVVTSAVLFVLYAIPTFAVAEVLRRTAGVHSLQGERVALAVAALTLGSLATLSRWQRAAMLDIVRQDFVRTAHAKGVSDVRVLVVHALRNALMPTVTLAGLQLPVLLGGAFVVEEVFALPGVGFETLRAIEAHDTAWLMAVVLAAAFATALGLIASDVACGALDPRVREALFRRRGGEGHAA